MRFNRVKDVPPPALRLGWAPWALLPGAAPQTPASGALRTESRPAQLGRSPGLNAALEEEEQQTREGRGLSVFQRQPWPWAGGPTQGPHRDEGGPPWARGLPSEAVLSSTRLVNPPLSPRPPQWRSSAGSSSRGPWPEPREAGCERERGHGCHVGRPLGNHSPAQKRQAGSACFSRNGSALWTPLDPTLPESLLSQHGHLRDLPVQKWQPSPHPRGCLGKQCKPCMPTTRACLLTSNQRPDPQEGLRPVCRTLPSKRLKHIWPADPMIHWHPQVLLGSGEHARASRPKPLG